MALYLNNNKIKINMDEVLYCLKLSSEKSVVNQSSDEGNSEQYLTTEENN